jgi:hypothetical protein
MQEVLVFGVKRYAFTNDDGERVEGTQVIYVEGLDYPFEEINMKGIFPMTVTHQSSDFFDKFPTLPGYYNVVFRQKPDRKGKPVSVPVDAKFVREFVEAEPLKAVK